MAQRLQMVRTKFERLAKRLSLSGLVSRHEAEQALREGHVHVNGVVATTNFEVPDVAEVHLHGKLIPPPVIRLWAFNKPRRVLCHMGEKEGIATLTTLFAKWFNIERERVGKTIIESVGFDDRELRHFNIVNPLSLGEEGIVLLANCGSTAQILHDQKSNIESVYMARVRGNVDPAIFRRWRSGVTAHGKYYGRVLAQLVKRADNSSWIRVGLVDRPNCPLHDLFHSVDLDIQRLRRQSFGPYLSSKIGEETLLPLQPHKLITEFLPEREERDALVPVISTTTMTTQRHDDVAVHTPS
eukprot:GEMP01046106.1.p1 GENE.GEMP01046106.1~~GEMP01046106.1.p1  ORF type:complete len:298 (+),score=70.07 GEMP01046106.1:261-1154(+)